MKTEYCKYRCDGCLTEVSIVENYKLPENWISVKFTINLNGMNENSEIHLCEKCAIKEKPVKIGYVPSLVARFFGWSKS